MDYSISGLAKLAGISTRTLRYYDEIGLLKPKDVSESGYRKYGPKEVDTLQQILLYRGMGVKLEDIKRIMTAPAFKRLKALEMQLCVLREKRRQVDLMIANVQKSIAFEKGETVMTDEEKFEGLKERLIQENESLYGAEARSLFGNEKVERSNAKFKSMTPLQYERMQTLSGEIAALLKKAAETKDPDGTLALKAYETHKEWLMFTWDGYSPDAHKGLAQMYTEDPRFKAYYDQIAPGSAEFLRDAILRYCR